MHWGMKLAILFVSEAVIAVGFLFIWARIEGWSVRERLIRLARERREIRHRYRVSKVEPPK